MTDYEDMDQRLARLARATEGIHPSAGFSARVMRAIDAEAAPSFLDLIWPSARRLVPIAAVVAGLAVTWAVQLDRSVDNDLAASYAVELE